MHTLARRIRRRRDAREFDRALRTASPAMHQELTAAASRAMFRTL